MLTKISDKLNTKNHSWAYQQAWLKFVHRLSLPQDSLPQFSHLPKRHLSNQLESTIIITKSNETVNFKTKEKTLKSEKFVFNYFLK